MSASSKKGCLYGVGVGPGDPELLTLKAVRIIKECPVIGIPGKTIESSVAYNIVKEIYPEIENKELFIVDSPMTKDEKKLEEAHDRSAQRAMEYLSKGVDVAILTLGDPTVYSTYIYIHRIVKDAFYPTEIVSGVPSFCAVAAKSGDSLVDKEEQLHIIPACYGMEETEELDGTLVYMKVGSRFSELKTLKNKKNGFFVENCGMKDEKVYNDIAELPDKGSYFSLGIVKEK